MGIFMGELLVSGRVAGGFKYTLFLPLPGEMIQFDEHIFQMGGEKPPIFHENRWWMERWGMQFVYGKPQDLEFLSCR